VAGGIVFCGALVWADHVWGAATTAAQGPWLEVAKLGIAALIGGLVTSVHHPARRGRKSTQPIAHAQILFCVAGALMMIIIGDSLARAFGAVGIASIVRFRTALKDPKDATVLFLLIGLGMSAGRGILGVAGLGTLFVCGLLWVLDHVKEEKPQEAMLEIRTTAPSVPAAHIQQVLGANHLRADPREMERGAEGRVRYHVFVDHGVTPDDVSAQLIDGGRHGITSVKWEMLKPRGE